LRKGTDRAAANMMTPCLSRRRGPTDRAAFFSDIKGSMELIQGSDPEEARRILDPTIAAMMSAVHRYEGTVNVANIGDTRSLAIHPATTTHSRLDPHELGATGVTDGYVRLSVGIEHIDDIIADIERGLAAAGKVAKAA
jgi:class 3 adenylate cyclase